MSSQNIFVSPELPSVYGVAVVRRTSRSLYFGSLGGRRSCHGHMYSPAGWVLPARHMLSTEHNSSAPCQPNDGTKFSFLLDGNFIKLFKYIVVTNI